MSDCGFIYSKADIFAKIMNKPSDVLSKSSAKNSNHNTIMAKLRRQSSKSSEDDIDKHLEKLNINDSDYEKNQGMSEKESLEYSKGLNTNYKKSSFQNQKHLSTRSINSTSLDKPSKHLSKFESINSNLKDNCHQKNKKGYCDFIKRNSSANHIDYARYLMKSATVLSSEIFTNVSDFSGFSKDKYEFYKSFFSKTVLRLNFEFYSKIGVYSFYAMLGDADGSVNYIDTRPLYQEPWSSYRIKYFGLVSWGPLSYIGQLDNLCSSMLGLEALLGFFYNGIALMYNASPSDAVIINHILDLCNKLGLETNIKFKTFRGAGVAIKGLDEEVNTVGTSVIDFNFFRRLGKPCSLTELVEVASQFIQVKSDKINVSDILLEYREFKETSDFIKSKNLDANKLKSYRVAMLKALKNYDCIDKYYCDDDVSVSELSETLKTYDSVKKYFDLFSVAVKELNITKKELSFRKRLVEKLFNLDSEFFIKDNIFLA